MGGVFVDIFDAMMKVSEEKQKQDDITEIRAEIIKLESKRCGHCDFWMKSSSCPAERNVNGRSKGPSMNEIACDKFIREKWIDDLISKKRGQLKNMR